MYLNIEYIYYKIYLLIRDFPEFLPDIAFWVQIAAAGISSLFIIGIVYNILKMGKLRKKELSEFVKVIIEEASHERASKWSTIKEYANSDNSSDWRRAILEADSLVDEIIERVGYKGKTFGERLSKIHPAQLNSLDELWTAHKVRNRIAHEGGHYSLSKEQTDKTLAFFEKVLKELQYI